MNRASFLVSGCVALSLVLGAACGDDGGGDETVVDKTVGEPTTEPSRNDAPAELVLTSPAFTDGGELPEEFSCNGAGLSPALAWTGLPDGTLELALTVEDPDTARGTFVHWVTWGIDPAPGELAQDTPGAVEGTPAWIPACPPPGDPHRYVFTLYALDAPLELSPGATIDELTAAVEGTTLGTAQLTGLYAPSGS